MLFIRILFILIVFTKQVYAHDTPWWGTIFPEPDTITASDPSAYNSKTYLGIERVTMYDRRNGGFWNTANAHVWRATYNDGLSIDVQINADDWNNESSAETQAEKYAWLAGQLPSALRLDVNELWIHSGTELFGGGNDSILIHTGYSSIYEADGILEETLVHEAAHTSIDAAHASSAGWLAAQIADAGFISIYAQDNPNREDIAETFLTWVMVRYFADRISPAHYDYILNTIPNRLQYLDEQNFDMSLYETVAVGNEAIVSDDLSIEIPIVAVAGNQYYRARMELSESYWLLTEASGVGPQASENLTGTFANNVLDLPCVIFNNNHYKASMALLVIDSISYFNLLSIEDIPACSISRPNHH